MIKNIDDLLTLDAPGFIDDLTEISFINPNSDLITEASMIMNKPYMKLAVYGNERDIPHFHFYLKEHLTSGSGNKYNNSGVCICITIERYFSHSKHTEVLNSRLMKKLRKFLNEKWSINNIDDVVSDIDNDFAGITNWDYIKYLWNTNNPDKAVPEELEMPDYYSTMPSISGKKGESIL